MGYLRGKHLWLLVMILSMVGCEVSNILRMRYANDHLAPIWPTGVNRQQLPLISLGEKPYIEVEVTTTEGQVRTLLLLIDTGAGISVLFDSDKVQGLTLPVGFSLPVYGWGDETASQGYQTEVAQLRLGNVHFNQVKLAMIPARQSRYFLRQDELDYDGIIGHDLLKHFSWTFDKQTAQLTMRAGAYQPQSGDIQLPMAERFSKISVPATVVFNAKQQVTQPLLIDTGSRHYLKLNTAYVEDAGINLPKAQVTAADFGLSGRTVHQRINVEQLQLGSLPLGPVKANVIPSDDEDDWWILGNALLNQFVMTIDYSRMQLYLRPQPGQPFRTLYNLPGLELRKLTDGAFVVRYVFPKLPAASSGLAEGDVIVQINQLPAAQISEAAWLALANQSGLMTLCTAQTCVQLDNQPIAGYSAPASR